MKFIENLLFIIFIVPFIIFGMIIHLIEMIMNRLTPVSSPKNFLTVPELVAYFEKEFATPVSYDKINGVKFHNAKEYTHRLDLSSLSDFKITFTQDYEIRFMVSIDNKDRNFYKIFRAICPNVRYKNYNWQTPFFVPEISVIYCIDLTDVQKLEYNMVYFS